MLNARERAVAFAKAVLQGDVDIIDGCRQLAGLRHDLDMSSDSSFLVFAAIDSDTDERPAGIARQRYSKKALVKIDAEIQEYLEHVRPEVLKACKEVIEKLS